LQYAKYTFDLSVYLVCISTTTRCPRHAGAEAMKALTGVAQVDLAAHPMSELAVQSTAPRNATNSYLNAPFIGKHCLFQKGRL